MTLRNSCTRRHPLRCRFIFQADSVDIDVSGTCAPERRAHPRRPALDRRSTDQPVNRLWVLYFVDAVWESPLEPGQDLKSLLHASISCVSTTVAMNRLIERRTDRVRGDRPRGPPGHDPHGPQRPVDQRDPPGRAATSPYSATQHRFIARTMIVGVEAHRLDPEQYIRRSTGRPRRKLPGLLIGSRSSGSIIYLAVANFRQSRPEHQVVRGDSRGSSTSATTRSSCPPSRRQARRPCDHDHGARRLSAKGRSGAELGHVEQLAALGYKGGFLMILHIGGSGRMFPTTASRTYGGGTIPRLIGSLSAWRPGLGCRSMVAPVAMAGLGRRPGRRRSSVRFNWCGRSSSARSSPSRCFETLWIRASSRWMRSMDHDLGGHLNVGPRSAGWTPARPATTRAVPSRPSPTPTSC